MERRQQQQQQLEDDSANSLYWQTYKHEARADHAADAPAKAVAAAVPLNGRAPMLRLRSSYAPPTSAPLSEDDEPDGAPLSGVREGRLGAAEAGGGKSDSGASGRKPAASEAVADAQLTELRARIREDTLACRQARPATFLHRSLLTLLPVRRRNGGPVAPPGRAAPRAGGAVQLARRPGRAQAADSRRG